MRSPNIKPATIPKNAPVSTHSGRRAPTVRARTVGDAVCAVASMLLSAMLACPYHAAFAARRLHDRIQPAIFDNRQELERGTARFLFPAFPFAHQLGPDI